MTTTLKAFFTDSKGDVIEVEGETLQALCDALSAAKYDGWYVHALQWNASGFYDRVGYVKADDYFA